MQSWLFEIAADKVLTPDQWKPILEIQGVERVVLHPKGTKTEQGNPGDHYQEHNFSPSYILDAR